MTHEEMQKAYYKACAHKILPCHFCGVPGDSVNRFCLPCATMICLECSELREMPYGPHSVEAHSLVPEDEIKTCWACGVRMKRPPEEADLCPRCEAEKLGGAFGQEQGGFAGCP